MAILNLQPPFDNITGTLEKRGIIHRQKHYKDDDGRILFIGKQEAYAVRNPRDYRKNPPQGEELRNINLFRQANSLTTRILRSADYTAEDLAQLPETDRTIIESLQSRVAEYKKRYKAQARKPDSQAPIDRRTHRRKQYVTLNTFIRAMLIQELKSRPGQSQQTPPAE